MPGAVALVECAKRDFWHALWRHFDVIHSRPPSAVENAEAMPGARWFVGARLNFAENLLRYRDDATGDHLQRRTGWARDAAATTNCSCRPPGSLPRCAGSASAPATASPRCCRTARKRSSACWRPAGWAASGHRARPTSACEGILDRFGQIEPKVLLAIDGYRFKGTTIAINDKIETCRAALPSVEHVWWCS